MHPRSHESPFRRLVVIVAAFSLLPLATRAEPRHALIMGAWEYTDPTYPSLPSVGGQSDVNRMKTTLEVLGFAVTVVTNPTLKTAKKAVDDFGAVIKAQPGTALFYFTGHGSEYDGKNFLIPTGTEISSNRDLDDEALSANRVLARMEESGGSVNIVFLDCCRNGLSMSGGRELAPMKAEGTFIGYATRSGKTAQTTRSGSLYTNALVKHLTRPGISIADMHTLVVKEVKAQDPTQNPAQYSELDDLFYFRASSATQVAKIEPSSVPTLADPPKAATPASASKERPFENMLGMKFVPVVNYQGGKKVLFSVWETRRQDYEAYASANSGVDGEWKAVEYKGVPVGQGNDHPVVNVSWEDAIAFAVWLTQRERAAGRIGADDEYRLPTDVEWSYAVGIGEKEEVGGTPESKDAKLEGIYPWGTVFPPPAGSGNYADSAAKAKNIGFGYIEGYTDGYATTAEVGSFEANRYGVYDLGGNVWEWCADWYNAEQKYRVLRGGSWNVYAPSFLLSSYRGFGRPGSRSDSSGFRVVLVVGSGG